MRTGLYSSDQFKGNCGFGLISHTIGQTSHSLLKAAVESLTRMAYGSGIAVAGKTDDGCGFLAQALDVLLRIVARGQFDHRLADQFIVGQLFLSPDENEVLKAREIFER
jgi:glutamate synthase (NADPH/NADH) large chain